MHRLLFLAGSIGISGAAGDRNVTIYKNKNAISGRVPTPGASSSSVTYLGSMESLSACEASCVNLPKCHGFVWHDTNFDKAWAKGCYGILDWQFQLPDQEDIISGRVGDWPQPGMCVTKEQCNYNGECVSRKCQCVPQWKGDACDVLNLLPSSPSLGYQGQGPGRSTSWGGSVLYGDDGLYHMYAAEINASCGMNVWLSNSQVIHATSPDPASQPFTRKSVVQGVFSHEPIAARAPTGEYVVYFTAVLAPNPLPVQGGRACTGCDNGRSPGSCGTDDQRNASVNLPTYMVYSKNADGPWSTPVMIPGTDVFADSNFAPVINPDGSLVALERGNVIHASDWKDASSYKVVGQWEDHGEDPFVWRDSAGIYHNIVHVYRENTVGLHYFSVDGVKWQPSPGGGAAYTHVIEYSDGTQQGLACRERPHIIQNKDGDIIALTNGAAPVTCHSAGLDDYAFTSLQVVGQSSDLVQALSLV